jgi:hypothetical protein
MLLLKECILRSSCQIKLIILYKFIYCTNILRKPIIFGKLFRTNSKTIGILNVVVKNALLLDLTGLILPFQSPHLKPQPCSGSHSVVPFLHLAVSANRFGPRLPSPKLQEEVHKSNIVFANELSPPYCST